MDRLIQPFEANQTIDEYGIHVAMVELKLLTIKWRVPIILNLAILTDA